MRKIFQIWGWQRSLRIFNQKREKSGRGGERTHLEKYDMTRRIHLDHENWTRYRKCQDMIRIKADNSSRIRKEGYDRVGKDTDRYPTIIKRFQTGAWENGKLKEKWNNYKKRAWEIEGRILWRRFHDVKKVLNYFQEKNHKKLEMTIQRGSWWSQKVQDHVSGTFSQ